MLLFIDVQSPLYGVKNRAVNDSGDRILDADQILGGLSVGIPGAVLSVGSAAVDEGADVLLVAEQIMQAVRAERLPSFGGQPVGI